MTNKIALSPTEERVVKYLKDKTQFIHAEYLMRRYGTKKGITVKECIDVLGSTELRKMERQNDPRRANEHKKDAS